MFTSNLLFLTVRMLVPALLRVNCPFMSQRWGTPPQQIDEKQVEQMAAIGCGEKEIGLNISCSDRLLERRFVGALKRGWVRRNHNLCKLQYDLVPPFLLRGERSGDEDRCCRWLGQIGAAKSVNVSV
jgi:hypothetical protein